MTESTETAESSEQGIPIPPSELLEIAAFLPEHWIALIDPDWRGESTPPDWTVVGWWRTGTEGTIEEWQDNPDYQPSPEALGWPEPADELDDVARLAATGYWPEADVPGAMVAAQEVSMMLDPEGGPLATTTPDGVPVVLVFTGTPATGDRELPPHERVAVPDLIARLEEGQQVFYVSLTAPVAVLIEKELLLEKIEAAKRATAEPAAATE